MTWSLTVNQPVPSPWAPAVLWALWYIRVSPFWQAVPSPFSLPPSPYIQCLTHIGPIFWALCLGRGTRSIVSPLPWELPAPFPGWFSQLLRPHHLPGAVHVIQDTGLRCLERPWSLEELSTTDALEVGQSLHRGHVPQLGSFCCGEGGCLEDRMHLSQEAKATHQPDGHSLVREICLL